MAKRPSETKPAKQISLRSPDLAKVPVSEEIPPRLLALAERLQEARNGCKRLWPAILDKSAPTAVNPRRKKEQ